MLHIDVICVGKLKEIYLRDCINEYSKRLSRYCNLSIVELPDEKLPDKLNDKLAFDIKERESNNILSHIRKYSYVVALDLRGKQYSSEDFSRKLENISLINSSITFVIGGTLGLSDKLISTCNELVCFSKMTFPHQLIRVFLLEQIFRAFKISNNETYHR